MSDGNKTWQDFQDTANRADVLRFLLDMGYEVSKRTFYRHCKDGKLKTGKGNKFTRRLVSAYAKNVLHLADQAETEAETETGALAVRNREQARRERLQRKMDEIKLQKLEKTVVNRELVSLEQAARAVALDTGFRNLVHSEAAEWILCASGDTSRLAEFMDVVLSAWDVLINNYATTTEFEVEFDV